MAATLRDRQIGSLETLLNLNKVPRRQSDDQSDTAHANGLIPQAAPILSSEGEPIWKVLVFDNLGRDVISSVMKVNDLRSWGVTIHLNINSARHTIPDVPVIYLVEPTPANVEAISADLQKGLYSPAHINFLSSVPRLVLEEFAARIANAGVAEHVAQVYDQYLNFIVSEPDLFSLGLGHDTYWAMNTAKIADDAMDAMVDRIVSGLFSVVVTMGVIPIIRCPPKGAADIVAAKLDRKLRDHILNSKDNLFSASNQRSNSSLQQATGRPVLVIVDRNVDIIPMLSHSWTYQSLVHDVLKMRLNRITVEVQDDSGSGKLAKRAYDVNANDFFWAKNASLPFPNVAEDIDAQLTKYRDDAAEVTRKTGASSIEDLQNDMSASAQHLKSAITLLPQLRERKATLDMHMNILSALLQGIKDRQLDTYYQLEEAITKQSKAQMLDFLKDSSKGTEPLDKLRLFIIWFLSVDQEVPRADMDRFEEALKATGVDTAALSYIRHVREITRMTMMSTAPAPQPQSSNELFRGFSAISSRLTDRFKDAGLGANFENLISGVKTFLPANRDFTLTKITESIMDPQNASSSAIAKTEGYLYFDPRNAQARGTMPPASQIRQQAGGVAGGINRGIEASFGQKRQAFNEAIVFTVGGGSMDEYGNLQEWAKRTSAANPGLKRRVVYGSTELLNSEDFVTKELARLGVEST